MGNEILKIKNPKEQKINWNFKHRFLIFDALQFKPKRLLFIVHRENILKCKGTF